MRERIGIKAQDLGFKFQVGVTDAPESWSLRYLSKR